MKEQWLHYKKLIHEAVSELKDKKTRKKQIPNILTTLRLLAPFGILPAAWFGNIPLACVFIAASSLTDMLDGYIARKYHYTSELGETLDAFADKIFAGTLLLAGSIFTPMLLFNLGLEFGISFLNVDAKLNNRKAKSSRIGKIKTCFLYPLIGVAFGAQFFNLHRLLLFLYGATTSLQLITLTSYSSKYKVEETWEEIEKENPVLHVGITNEEENKKEYQNELEYYKQIRDLLVHELEIQRENPLQDKPKVKTKTK